MMSYVIKPRRQLQCTPCICAYACMCVCMYVCVYVYMYVCIHMRLYVWVYVCVHDCRYVCTRMFVCMYMCMYACVCKYVCMYACMYVCICMYGVCIYVCKYMYAYMYVCIYPYTYVSNNYVWLRDPGLAVYMYRRSGFKGLRGILSILSFACHIILCSITFKMSYNSSQLTKYLWRYNFLNLRPAQYKLPGKQDFL